MDPGGQIPLETLSLWFVNSLSPQPEPRRRAEEELSRAADAPGFSISLLRLASSPSADDQVRHAAAVHFKNHLRARWSPSLSDQNPNPSPLLSPPEKDQIKVLLVGLMLSSPPRVRSQLGEALAVVSAHDFPRSWPGLLPELVSSLRSATDCAAINGLLAAANSIFKRFRTAFSSDNAVRLDLKYCLDGFAAPLLEVFLRTARGIEAAMASAPDAALLRQMFESQRLCCRIFFSLNSVELPEFFEDHMKEWMAEFKAYLSTAYAPPVEADGTVDTVRAAICENLELYMRKNEEEFQAYLGDFVSAVYTLLMTSSPSSSRDRLTVTAIKFLTTVSTSVHHALFGSPEVLPQICQSIVFPNIRVRDEDEELFEMNYVEYIRRDIEHPPPLRQDPLGLLRAIEPPLAAPPERADLRPFPPDCADCIRLDHFLLRDKRWPNLELTWVGGLAGARVRRGRGFRLPVLRKTVSVWILWCTAATAEMVGAGGGAGRLRRERERERERG